MNDKNPLSNELKLFVLKKLIPKNEKLYTWCYSTEGELLATTCEDYKLVSSLFIQLKGFERALTYLKKEDNGNPLIIGSPIGLYWSITIDDSDTVHPLIYVTGPVFYHKPPADSIITTLSANHLHVNNRQTVADILTQLPIMSYGVFIRYALIVHNAVSRQCAELEDIMNEEMSEAAPAKSYSQYHDHNRVYLAEKAMLQMVRTGDLSYQDAFQTSILLSNGVPVESKDPLRQAKTSVIVFTTLACRAAMEGGLSPTEAYPLGDSYIQAAENCTDSGELSTLCNAMYHDFIFRVHRANQNPSYSYAIRKCCDYIEINWNRKIETEELSSLVGYTDYYLTEKFKNEVGISLNQYIKKVKIERAKLLLSTTETPVAEIADKLAFNTPNYFIQVFKEIEGLTPAQYRKKNNG